MTVLELKQDAPEIAQPCSTISIKNVLYATDFSAISESALPYATAICRQFGATLHVVHVLSDVGLLLMTGGVDYVSFGTLYEDAQNVAKAKVDKVTARLGKIPNRAYVRHGKVWANLSNIVEGNSIDLIVIGTHGRTGLGKLLLGSVAEDILRHSACPVLTVGPEICGRARLPEEDSELATTELEIRHVLCAAKLTPASITVGPVAIALSGAFRARLTMLHVLEDYSDLGSRSDPTEDAMERLQAVLPRDARLAYAPEFVMEFGPAAQRILNAAKERDSDLIVMGARPADGATHLPWSTVHKVVAHACCPVLTVPA